MRSYARVWLNIWCSYQNEMLYLANDNKDYKQVCAKFRAQLDINTR